MGIGWSMTPLIIEPPSITADGWTPDYTFATDNAKNFAPASDSAMPWFGKPNSWNLYRSKSLTDQIIAASQGVLTGLDSETYSGYAVNGDSAQLSVSYFRPHCHTLMQWKLSNMTGLDWAGSLSGAWEPKRLYGIGRPHKSNASYYYDFSNYFCRNNVDTNALLADSTAFNLETNWTGGQSTHGALPYQNRNNFGGYVLSHPQHGVGFVSSSAHQRTANAIDAATFLVMIPDKVTGLLLGLHDSSFTPTSFGSTLYTYGRTPFGARAPAFYPYGLASHYAFASTTSLHNTWSEFAGDWRKGAKMITPAPVLLQGMPCAYFSTGDVMPAPLEANHWLKAGWEPGSQWHHFVADGSVWLTSATGQFALRLDSTWTESSLKAALYSRQYVKVIT